MNSPISGVQSGQSVLEKERLDFNPNAIPPYLQNDVPHFDPNSSPGIDPDFSSAGRRAIFNLRIRNREVLNLNYILNLQESSSGGVQSTTQALTSEESSSSGSSSSGSVGSTGSSSGSSDVENDLVDAAEDTLEEAEDLAEDLKEGNWVITDDSGYQYVDPEFYVRYEKLLSYLNRLQVFGMALDAIAGIKKAIIGMLSKDKNRGSSSGASASEVLATARESGMLMGQAQLLEANEQAWTFNQARLQKLAVVKPREEASASWYDYVSEVVTSGGSDAADRHRDARAAEMTYEAIKEWESFQKEVQALYERVLGDSSLFSDGLTNTGNIYEQLTWLNLTVDIGALKVDVDRNQLLANQMQLSGYENFRRLYFMLQQAKQELKNIVVEGTTGIETSANTKQVIGGVLESLEKFENMVFSALAYQLQTAITSQNMRVDARNQADLLWDLYYSSVTLGSIPLVGGLTRSISDWIALELHNAFTDYVTSPSQLDMNEVYRILADLYGTSVEQIRDDLSSGDEYSRKLEELEQREWEIIGRLSEENVVYTGNDDYQGIYESVANDLREELVQVENGERLIVMLVEALAKLKRIVIKITTGLGDVDIGDDAKTALKAGFENRLLAFDLKFAGIKNKVEAYNKALQMEKMLDKARWVAGSLGLAAVVATVLCIVFPPAGIAAWFFIISGAAGLGAALGSIFYNLANPVDDTIYDKTDFYDDTADKIEDMYDEQLDHLTENSHVDGEDSWDPLSAGDQWVFDTKLAMDVRNRLTRIYLYEQLLLMLTKASQDIKNIVVSSFTGVYTGDDYDQARGASSARFDQKISAYGLKEDMVKDIISRRNMAVAQDTELRWAVVSAVISAMQIVFGGLGGGLEGAVAKGFTWAAFGAEVTNLALQATKNLMDATSGYDELGKWQEIKETIDMLIENAFDQQTRQALQGALYGVNENQMLESVGSGQVVADASNYYQGMRQLQLTYNRIIIVFRVAEAIARIRARIVGAPTVSGTADALEAEKASYLKQLDLLYDRVQTYVEIANQHAQAWRNFAVSLVGIALVVFLKVAEHKGWMAKWKAKLNEALGTTDKDFKVVDIDKQSRFMATLEKILTGKDKATWQGRWGWNKVVNLTLDLTVFNKTTFEMIARKIYDKANQGGQEAEKVSQVSQPLTDSKVDQMDIQAYNNQLELAAIEVYAQELGIDQELASEWVKFLDSTVEDTVNSFMDDSWVANAIAIKDKKNPNSENELTVPEEIQEKFSRLISQRFSQVDWENQAQIKEFLKEAKEVGWDAAVCILVAEKVAEIKSPETRQKAMENLENIFDQEVSQNTNRDKALMSYALAILGNLTKRQVTNPDGKASPAISEKEVDSLVLKVWQKVSSGEISEEDAKEICELVIQDRPQAVHIGRIVAENILSEPALVKEVKEHLAEVKWQSSDPQEFAKQLEAVQKVIQEKTEAEDQTLKPDQQAIINLASALAAQAIVSNPQVKEKALENLKSIIQTPDAKGLKAYAEAILQRVEGKTSKEIPTKIEEAIYRLYARAKAIEFISQDKVKTPEEFKKLMERVDQQLDSMKKEVSQLIRQDAKRIGIDFQKDPSQASLKLQEVLKSINECKSLDEMAGILQKKFLENPEFAKLLTPTLRKYLEETIEILKDISRKLVNQKKASTNPKDTQPQLSSSLWDTFLNDLPKTIKGKEAPSFVKGDKGNRHQKMVVVAVNDEERGRGSSDSHKQQKENGQKENKNRVGELFASKGGVWGGWEEAQEEILSQINQQNNVKINA